MAPPSPLSVSAKASATTAATSSSSSASSAPSAAAYNNTPREATHGSPSSPSSLTAAGPSSALLESSAAPPPQPELPPLHYAAQTGDLTALYSLLPENANDDDDEAQASAVANSRDAQGITALHWAAINNQVVACKVLLERGKAEVDARGGELDATPLQWAAR